MTIRVGSEQERVWILKQYPYTQQVLGEGGTLLLAVEGEEILGMLWSFTRQIPAPVEGTEWFINVIEVFRPEEQCKGIASAMVQMCIDMARKQGAYQVRAYCDMGNIASHRLWRRNGFSICPVSMDGQMVGSYVAYVL